MHICSCAALWFVLLLSAETATARTRLAEQPATAGSRSTALDAACDSCGRESALCLSLASLATSGAAYAYPHQQHAQQSPHIQSSRDTASVVHSLDISPRYAAFHLPNSPHKPLFPNVDKWDVLLLLCTAITLFIAAGGGIGGGAVFVVLYVFVGGFTAPQAVALSNITILGGSLANFIANSMRRHPALDRPLIDWDLILVMEPTTMLGALLGGYLNKLFPMWLTSCLLTALLTLLTWKLIKRGTSTFKAETRLMQHQQHQQQEEKQRQQQAVAVIAELQEPLLVDTADIHADDVDNRLAGSASDDRDHSSTWGPLKQVVIRHLGSSSHPAAWFDCDCHHGDQVCYAVHDAAAQCAAAADSHSAVLPVPPHLRPLNVSVRQQQQHNKPGDDISLSPERQQQLSPPATAAARLDCSYQVPLLAPHHPRNSSSGGAGICCCLSWFSCLSPDKLDISRVQAYERQQLPWQPLLLLFFLSCWVVLSDTLKVTLQCGTLTYWLVALSVVPPAAAVTLLVRQWLLTKTAVKTAAACTSPTYEALTPPRAAAAPAAGKSGSSAGVTASGDIHWTPQNSLLYPVLCSAAGVVAGLFGVGGGIVKGPLMLELGVCPEVTAATSATMIMFTAGSAAVVYINFGGVVTDYAVALLLVGFTVTLLGQLCTIRLVRVLGRRSVIIFAMSTLMVLAASAASYQSVVAVAAALHEGGGMWRWGSICQRSVWLLGMCWVLIMLLPCLAPVWRPPACPFCTSVPYQDRAVTVAS